MDTVDDEILANALKFLDKARQTASRFSGSDMPTALLTRRGLRMVPKYQSCKVTFAPHIACPGRYYPEY
jgi:hypothetical protein